MRVQLLFLAFFSVVGEEVQVVMAYSRRRWNPNPYSDMLDDENVGSANDAVDYDNSLDWPTWTGTGFNEVGHHIKLPPPATPPLLKRFGRVIFRVPTIVFRGEILVLVYTRFSGPILVLVSRVFILVLVREAIYLINLANIQVFKVLF